MLRRLARLRRCVASRQHAVAISAGDAGNAALALACPAAHAAPRTGPAGRARALSSAVDDEIAALQRASVASFSQEGDPGAAPLPEAFGGRQKPQEPGPEDCCVRGPCTHIFLAFRPAQTPRKPARAALHTVRIGASGGGGVTPGAAPFRRPLSPPPFAPLTLAPPARRSNAAARTVSGQRT